jgi:hypothetical protein
MSSINDVIRIRDSYLRLNVNLVGGLEWNVSWDEINREVRVTCLESMIVQNYPYDYSCFNSSADAICCVADAFYMALEVMGSGGKMSRMDVKGETKEFCSFYFKFKTSREMTEGDRAFGIKELGL